MKHQIIGREEEQAVLQRVLDSKRAEFVAVYGRRRIGKTYLVRNFFVQKKCIFFHATGIKDGSLPDQIARFTVEIGKAFYAGAGLKIKETWLNVFEQLTQAINTISTAKEIILFFDEFPWMATKKSKIVSALDYYWNRYWVNDSRIKLLICGSSASWIIHKLIYHRGGLHNRITQRIELHPFSLKETKDFLKYLGARFEDYQILNLYMVTGGVPFYLAQIQKGYSAIQNIDFLCFKKEGLLFDEFQKLFASLFDDFQVHEKLIRAIAKHRYGIKQAELFKNFDELSRGGRLVGKLRELEEAGFIMSFLPYGHRQKGIYYRIIDEYTLFYIHWIEPILNSIKKRDKALGYWQSKHTSADWRSWAGYAFEAICYKHISQIRKKLNIDISAEVGSWRHVPRKKSEAKGAQIDLLFDRNDSSVTICEIKYNENPFTIDKKYAEILQNKVDVYRKQTKTNKQIFIAMITVCGLKQTIYSEELISNCVVLKDFFE